MQTNLSPEEIFEIWAPAKELEDEKGPGWTKWTKPLLFSYINKFTPLMSNDIGITNINFDWIHNYTTKPAIIVELPGIDSVRAGIELAKSGYRPIPLFNSCPNFKAVQAIDVSKIIVEIINQTEDLRNTFIAPEAPPAFLLDSLRLTGCARLSPGVYDNRWMVLPQDFPSANYLLSHGVNEVVVINAGGNIPLEILNMSSSISKGDDIKHVLYRWQEAGIKIKSININGQSSPQDELISKPRMFKSIWYRILAMAGLYSNCSGGFGGIIPTPGSGG